MRWTKGGNRDIPSTDEMLDAMAADTQRRDWLGGPSTLRHPWVRTAQGGDLDGLKRQLPGVRPYGLDGLNGLDESSGYSALGAAASEGHLQVVAWLVDHGASIDTGGRNRESPLQLAITFGHDEVATWLIEHGAALDHYDRWGETALHTAAETGNGSIVALLLAAGADPAGGTSEFKPILRAIRYGQVEIVRTLSAAGAPIPNETPAGATPLHLAVKSGEVCMAQWLLANGHAADLDAFDAGERTPIDIAHEAGLEKMRRYLVRYRRIHQIGLSASG